MESAMQDLRQDTAREQTGYFLAGHQAQAGVYHEMQTGREIEMKEAGLLPATCDGHVAVYVRRPSTWAEKDHSLEDHSSQECF